MNQLKNKEYAIIVAGGKGLRMNTEIPKQFLLLNNIPILMHSIQAFYNYNSQIKIIVVLPKSQIEYWKSLCVQYNFTISHSIICGGDERFFSVQAGLTDIDSEGFVAIHDGVRPLVTPELIERGFACAQQYGSAVPVVDSTDSIRILENDTNYSIDRNKVKRVQTPQIFDVKQLISAYSCEYLPFFTDDASVWEHAGNTIYCYAGNEHNIKITNQSDLEYAEILKKFN